MRITPCHKEGVAAVISLGPRVDTVGVYTVRWLLLTAAGCCWLLLLLLPLPLPFAGMPAILPSHCNILVCLLADAC